MIRNIFICCIYLLSFSTINAQTFDWARAFGGTTADEGTAIDLDDNGNIYTTGFFSGTVDFDPGPNTFNLSTLGLYNVFIQKMDASGNFVWVKSFETTSSGSYVQTTDIHIDVSGNIFTVGNYKGDIDFDPGPGTVIRSASNSRLFVHKMDASGNFVWVKVFGDNSYYDKAQSIVTDASGNVYVTGAFSGTTDFEPGTGVYHLTAAGLEDIFILKLDASGGLVWAKSVGGGFHDQGLSIGLDTSDNVYITGFFHDTVDFDPDTGTFNLIANGLNSDIFILKLDTSGNFIWAKAMGGTDLDLGQSIAIDDTGNIYLTGNFSATVDFDPGPGIYELVSEGDTDIFVMKMDLQGNLLWAKSFGAQGSADQGTSLDIDASGNVYTTGAFRFTVDFNPGTGIYELTSNGYRDVFILKLDELGQFIWATSFGGNNGDWGNAIILDSSDNIYTTGYFENTVNFDTGSSTWNLTSSGARDIFVHKIGQTSTSISENCSLNQIKIYPNPNNGIFSMKLNKLYDKIDISIRDLTGKNIFLNSVTHTQSIDFSLPQVPEGVYFIQIISDNKTNVVKWIKK